MSVNQFSTSVLKPVCQANSRGIDMAQNQSFTPALKGEADFSLLEFESSWHPFRGWGFLHSKNK